MLKLLQDKWLLQLNAQSFELVSVSGSGAYHSGEVDDGSIRVLTGCDSPHDDVTTTFEVNDADEFPYLAVHRKLPNGLELKPLKIPIHEGSSFSLSSGLNNLIKLNHDTQAELKETQKQLQTALTVNREMSEDKAKYQDLVLDRVCAMLDERNFWMQKIKNAKEEQRPQDPSTFPPP